MSDNSNQPDEASLPRPDINPDECKSCGRCICACPQKCLRVANHLNIKGVRPTYYTGSGCTGCAICYYNCPEPYAIRILKRDKGAPQ